MVRNLKVEPGEQHPETEDVKYHNIDKKFVVKSNREKYHEGYDRIKDFGKRSSNRLSD